MPVDMASIEPRRPRARARVSHRRASRGERERPVERMLLVGFGPTTRLTVRRPDVDESCASPPPSPDPLGGGTMRASARIPMMRCSVSGQKPRAQGQRSLVRDRSCSRVRANASTSGRACRDVVVAGGSYRGVADPVRRSYGSGLPEPANRPSHRSPDRDRARRPSARRSELGGAPVPTRRRAPGSTGTLARDGFGSRGQVLMPWRTASRAKPRVAGTHTSGAERASAEHAITDSSATTIGRSQTGGRSVTLTYTLTPAGYPSCSV